MKNSSTKAVIATLAIICIMVVVVTGALHLAKSAIAKPNSAEAAERANSYKDLVTALSDGDSTTLTLAATPVADLRQVTLDFADETSDTYLVHKSQVNRFVEATKLLHYEPGINPANGAKTTQVRRISVTEPTLAGPYWWTTPDLKTNGDRDHGAFYYDFHLNSHVIWEAAEKK